MTAFLKADITAEVTFLPTAEGGRQGPTQADWYGCPLHFEGDYFDIRFDLSSIGCVSPGETVRVPARFLFPELIKPRLAVGSLFTLWEGRTVGQGRVLKIHEDA
jgi:hypothetical protein